MKFRQLVPAIAIVLCIPLILTAQMDNQEFRATWVITWNHSSSSSTADQNMARIRSIMDKHVQANMNAVLFQVRQNGTVYYPSSYEPWGSYVGYSYPGFDPLAYAVEQAHARGLELHAWMNTFESRGAAPGSPAAEHPTWVCRDGSGNSMPKNHALSPGIDSVRSYLLDVAMEIVNNYDVDGLHLDYVRWNEYTTTSVWNAPLIKGDPQMEMELDGFIAPSVLQALLAAPPSDRYLYDIDHPHQENPPDSIGGGQFPSWGDYWRWCVTEFVHTLHDSIQAAKPWVRLSTAALGKYNWDGWQGYGTVFQDAALWFNQGYIEQLTPMHYHWDTGSEFTSMLAQWQPSIQPGIDAGRLYTVGPGSYNFANWGAHPNVVNACRTVVWVDGFQFFSYGSWDSYQYWNTAGTTFFGGKAKVRPTKLIVAENPEAPSIAVLPIDSLTYQLTVTPPVELSGDHRFIIYRSEDAAIDTASDTIIDIHFGSNEYTIIEPFTGLQDYNGTYYYGATVLDRYWNESVPSPAGMTGLIPSLPPTVVATAPQDSAVALVTAPITVEFSKTMDTTTLAGAVSIDPPATIAQIVWSDDLKTATINWLEDLAYETPYTLILDSNATDINGTRLDGNGDGIPGDSFRLDFFTQVLDTIGPVIVASYPTLDVPADSILRDDVVTLVFNEHLDQASISETTLELTTGSLVVPIHYKTTNVRRRTVLSLQPLTANFSAGASYNLLIRKELSDSAGNPMAADINLSFPVSYFWNTQTVVLDDFMSTASWETPGYSGSTVGIIGINTTFSQSATAYLPNSHPRLRSSARLHYEWMDADTTFLLREYCSGSPRNIAFDSSYVLQCFVFGDSSHNRFRFALDDGYGDASNHEVSEWILIDWHGWRQLEWDLSDTSSFGSWLGNRFWNFPNNIHFDSFQLTHEHGSSQRVGEVYFDNLRVVKQDFLIGVKDRQVPLPTRMILGQNYPNPFNAVTTVPFYLPRRSEVELAIYDLRGRLVKRLLSRELESGSHSVTWRGDNATGAHVASGVYLIRLQANGRSLTRQMVLLK